MGATYYICNREVRNIRGGGGEGVMRIQRAAKGTVECLFSPS